MKHQYGDVEGVDVEGQYRDVGTTWAAPAGPAVLLPAPADMPEPADAALMRSVIEQMDTMVVLINGNSTIRLANPAVTRMLGFDTADVVGRSFLRYVAASDRSTIIAAVESLPPGESVALDANFATSSGGSLVFQFTVANLLHDDSIRSFVVTGQPAPALADARARMAFLASHDQRTGLLNRDGFMVAAQQLVERGGGLGLLLVDLVHFRSVNELYGEAVGDAVLQTIANRIEDLRWPGQVVARLGADEFVIAIPAAARTTVERLRDRVLPVVGTPVVADGNEVNFTLRTALAYDAGPESLDALLASASNDLRRIKRHADPEAAAISNDALAERRRQVDLLRTALTNGEIEPFFDPIVDHEGRIVALEALVRRVDPLHGVVGAASVLPLARMAGLTHAIDEVMLAQSLAFARRLSEYGAGDIRIHINVDPSSIASPGFAQRLVSRTDLLDVAHDQIVVELTENDLLAPSSVTLGNLHALRQAGISVAIDDFGTGYSSLAHLLELPVDEVKIDRRFIAGIDVDLAATNLTKAIIGLCESLDLRCIAEGVEQPYQQRRLRELGCRSFQGWLYAHAMPGDEVITSLARSRRLQFASDDTPRLVDRAPVGDPQVHDPRGGDPRVSDHTTVDLQVGEPDLRSHRNPS